MIRDIVGMAFVSTTFFVVLHFRQEPDHLKPTRCYELNLESTNQKKPGIVPIIWIESDREAKNKSLRIILYGGGFRAVCDYLRIETLIDNKWKTIADFDRTWFCHEVLQAELTDQDLAEIEKCLSEIGYPNPENTPNRLRINVGRLLKK